MNPSFSLRRAVAEDADALSALAIETYVAAFGHTFRAGDLEYHLANNLTADRFAQAMIDDEILLAEIEGHLIGYTQFGAIKTPYEIDLTEHRQRHDHELRRLYVDAAYRNAGVGHGLMEAALARPQMRSAANLYLEVWEHNPGAQRFYERHDFAVIGTRTFTMLSGPADSLERVMVRRQSSDASAG